MRPIYEYRDYKLYLSDFIAEHGPSRSGLKTQMAKAMGCQLPYLSQVLHKSAELSLEQAIRLSPLLGLSDKDREFFVLIMQLSRAGSAELKRHFENQIENALEARLDLKKRLGAASPLSVESQAEYYRHWATSAIHMMLTIPALQTKQALADQLQLPIEQVAKVLQFLVSAGFAVESKGRFITGAAKTHLGKDSPFASRHHANWRLRAIEARGRQSSEDVSYSSVVTLSRNDCATIRQMIVDFIEASREVVHRSNEEEAFAFCIDFFRV